MGTTGKQRGGKVFGRVQTLSSMQNVNATLPSEDDQVIKRASTTLTAAQVKALNTTPRSILAAPGAGKANVIVEIFATHNFLTTSFAGSNDLEFHYTSSSGAKVTADMDNAFLLATEDAYSAVKGVVTNYTPVENAPIAVNVATGDPTQGLGSVNFKVYYRTITL